MAKFKNDKGEWLVDIRVDGIVVNNNKEYATEYPDTGIVFDILERLSEFEKGWRME